MLGWIVRNVRDGEDRRWQLWRERWLEGEGLFAIRSVGVNLFAFYQVQAFATVLVLTVPLAIACQNTDVRMHLLKWVAVGVCGISILLENIADFQLDQFRQRSSGTGGVCRSGLWNYSRHPNYFFEFLIWVSYAMYALPSAVGLIDYFLLLLVPVAIYWFLVYFTGIPITELASASR
ncbi:MAG: steroid 5-alpha reductase family enzyme [Mariniblastus sp.]|jgi:steroid 5-alpha reductase family enzyme